MNTIMDDQTYYDDRTKIAFLPGAPDQNKGSGGLCASLQNGANATGAELKALVRKLQEHGYKKCGSIPTLVTIGVNDVSKGELTVKLEFACESLQWDLCIASIMIKGGQRMPQR